jgi:hypothetical protein
MSNLRSVPENIKVSRISKSTVATIARGLRENAKLARLFNRGARGVITYAQGFGGFADFNYWISLQVGEQFCKRRFAACLFALTRSSTVSPSSSMGGTGGRGRGQKD